MRRPGWRVVVGAAVVAAVAACSDSSGPSVPAAHHLAFEGTPVVIGSGAGFAPTLMVTVRAADGALVAEWSEGIQLSLAGQGVELEGASSVVPLGGVAGFPELTVSGNGSGVRLTARSGTLEDATSEPFDVPGAFSSASVAAGAYHTCALDAEGRAYCWGRNDSGQLGDGTTADRSLPTPVAGGVRYASLTAGWAHTCGLTAAGAVHCWGEGGIGQVGVGTTADVPTPTPVTLPRAAVQVSAGYYHTCALLEDRAAYCWGYNYDGALGTSSSEDAVTAPEAVTGGLAFVSVSSGYEHSCGLTAEGAAYCWGRNTYGQLGDGTRLEARPVPTPVLGDVVFSSLVAGGGPCHGETCGVGADGTTYCWGRNYQRATGPTSEQFATAPAAVAGGPGFVSVVPGPLVVCGLDAQGALWCWGEPFNGQLANGSGGAVQDPTPVMPTERIRSVAMGMEHVCVSTDAGETWCWGTNGRGQLGNPSNPLGWMRPVPVWAPPGG